jgi:phage shock protein C
MFCTQCGLELRDRDRFCSQCGAATGLATPPATALARLTRDVAHKRIAGVCAGFAEFYGVDVILVRVIWLAVALCTGVGFLAYLAAWIIMPKTPGQPGMIATEVAPQT